MKKAPENRGFWGSVRLQAIRRPRLLPAVGMRAFTACRAAGIAGVHRVQLSLDVVHLIESVAQKIVEQRPVLAIRPLDEVVVVAFRIKPATDTIGIGVDFFDVARLRVNTGHSYEQLPQLVRHLGREPDSLGHAVILDGVRDRTASSIHDPQRRGNHFHQGDPLHRNQLGRRNLSKQDYKLLLGRRYNRAKKADNARPGNDNASKERGGQNVHREKTAEKLAKEHGVDEKTVRRAGKFQAAAATLGIEKEIAAGKVKASEAAVVKAATSLPLSRSITPSPAPACWTSWPSEWKAY